MEQEELVSFLAFTPQQSLILSPPGLPTEGLGHVLFAANQLLPTPNYIALNQGVITKGDRSFDAVIAPFALSTLTTANTLGVLISEIARVLRPNGRLLLQEYDVREIGEQAQLDLLRASHNAVSGVPYDEAFRLSYTSCYWRREEIQTSLAFFGFRLLGERVLAPWNNIRRYALLYSYEVLATRFWPDPVMTMSAYRVGENNLVQWLRGHRDFIPALSGAVGAVASEVERLVMSYNDDENFMKGLRQLRIQGSG